MDRNGFQSNQNFPALTGFRAFAALLVFFHHFNPFTASTLPFRIVNEGHIGVTLFFVLSGFLITYRYSDTYVHSRSWWSRYIQNRFARIYPVFFLLTVLGFRLKNEVNPQVWIVNLSLAKAWFDDLKFTGIGPAWSLSVEEVFYLLVPTFLFFFRRIGFWLTLTTCYLIGFGLLGLGSQIDFFGFFSNLKFAAFFTFWGRAFEFLLGMYFALLYKKGTLPKFLSSFKYKTVTGIILVIISMYVLSLITVSDSALTNATSSLSGIAINNLILPPFVGLLIWGLLEEKTLIRSILSSGPLLLFGGASYTFYLVQQSVLGDVLHALGFNDVLTQFFPAVLFISVVIYLGFEHPIHKLLKSKK